MLTKNPFLPSLICSGIPAKLLPITGILNAKASEITLGRSSNPTEGTTKMSITL